MMLDFARSMLGWFTMVMAMGYFIWLEFRNSELELEEDEEPPGSRLVVPVVSIGW
ncbi:MAG: hypothetical protein K8T10_14405 [Candidatus Eremiobacteraeota bacterium]|nr:hypothetical protein [Candidatus Eremiobacteraeota bacterium]